MVRSDGCGLGMPTEALVVGGRGLLGSAILAELRRRGVSAHAVKVRWDDEALAGADLAAALAEVAGRGADLQLWWCAGTGVTATHEDQLAAELRVLARFVDQIAALAAVATTQVSVFYASSAGAIYAGAADPPFTEATVPAPLSAYGTAKLEAERLVSSVAGEKVSVAIARISNLYGPGQDLSKPQGLVSQLCLAAYRRRPLNIYVSLDTLRDYLHVDDAAVRCVRFVDAVAGGSTACLTKIICSGVSVSVGSLLAESNRIFRRRVPVVLAASPLGRQQARDLRLASIVLTDVDRVASRPIVVGMDEIRRMLQGRSLMSSPR
ncbi:MAG: epimerase [Actinobacteria bacterium HGW-Actinobacteria-2]|nr:MAG: epimerase [Actinobacteria bacterium HGW-Actinobacteria-2]